MKDKRHLPEALEGFDTFEATAAEVLKHKRKGGPRSKRTHSGKRGTGSYTRKDMAWLKVVVQESSGDPRLEYLEKIQKLVNALCKQVSLFVTQELISCFVLPGISESLFFSLRSEKIVK